MAAARSRRDTGIGRMKSAPVNILVVEDAPHVRKRLIALLGTVDGAKVVGESEAVRDAVRSALDGPVDVVLLDLQLTDGNGLDVLAAVKPQRPQIRFIVLSNLATPQHRAAAMAAGADVFLDKSHEFGRVPGILRGWSAAADAVR